MKKGRDLSFFEGKVNVKDLCREQMRILKKFNFKPKNIQQNKNKTTRIASNKRVKQKKIFQIKNEIDEESPKPQPFTPPIPMNFPKEMDKSNNKNDAKEKDSKNKNEFQCSESPITSIYTDSGQLSDLTNILQPQLKIVEYPITSVIQSKSIDKNTVNSPLNPIVTKKKVVKKKNSKYDIKLNRSKPLVVNYISSSSSTSIPTTLTSSSTVKRYNDNIFPSSDSSPPFTPLPPPPKQQQHSENHHLSKSIPTSISIPSTLTATAKSSSKSTTITSSSTTSSIPFNKYKMNTPSNSSSTIPSELGLNVVVVNNYSKQKVGVNTPPPPPELLINKDLLLPRRLRQVISPVLKDSESSSSSNSNLLFPIKNEVKPNFNSSSISSSSYSSFHPSFLSKTIKPSYSPVSSPNRKRNHKVIIKQSPLSSPYKYLNKNKTDQKRPPVPTLPIDSTSSSCSLILDSNKIKNNLKIPSDNVSDILVKDIKNIIDSSRKSIESMKEDVSLKTIKEENTEDERSSIDRKQNSMIMNNIVKRIDFESSSSEEEENEENINDEKEEDNNNEEEDSDDEEEEIIGYYSAKSSFNQMKKKTSPKETNQSPNINEKEEKIEKEENLQHQSLSNLNLPLPNFPIFDESDSQSDDTKSTTSSSTIISKLINYSPKYMTRDEIEDKYNKVCFKYPPLFLDSDFLDL